MNCPRCQIALQVTILTEPQFSIEIDQCPACKGIWFDRGELQTIDKVVEPVGLEIRDIPSEYEQLTPLFCPSCDEHPRMDKADHPRDKEVIIDVCPTCEGIWLDRGELKAIQQENWWSSIWGLWKNLT